MTFTPTHITPQTPSSGARAYFRAAIAEEARCVEDAGHFCRFQKTALGCPHISANEVWEAVLAGAEMPDGQIWESDY